MLLHKINIQDFFLIRLLNLNVEQSHKDFYNDHNSLGFRGKEFNRKTLENTFRIGIGIIAMLMIFTIFNDIHNFLLRYQN